MVSLAGFDPELRKGCTFDHCRTRDVLQYTYAKGHVANTHMRPYKVRLKALCLIIILATHRRCCPASLFRAQSVVGRACEASVLQARK